jgi:omega-6 fatty acid desaturase (delta-12 desaturase)
MTRLRSGVELIAATKTYARERSLESWWHVLSTGLLLLLALGGTLTIQSPFGRAICSVLTGLLILRFFVIYHDQQHHAILGTSKLAEWLMRAFGIYALSASSVWRSSHNHHHQHNSKLRGSHIGSFPIMTAEQFAKSPRPLQREYLFVRHPGTILFGYVFMFLYGMCLNPTLKDPRRHWDCLTALVLHIAIGVGLYFWGGWTAVIFTQTVPHFIAYAIGTYLFYAQHNFPGVSFKDRAGWTYEKAALESSSYMKMGPIMAWFTANIGYHHVHHLNARIPFYRLPEAHNGIPELKTAKVTSLWPADIFRCLRLKVWDPQTQAMVGIGDRPDETLSQSGNSIQA